MKKILLLLVLLVPTLVYAQTFTVTETELLKVDFDVSDPDGDDITITYSEPLDNKGEWTPNYDQAGEYASTITISDGISVVEKEVTILVLNKNRAPELKEVPELYVREGETILQDIEGTDPDNDKTILSWYKIPVGSKIKNRVFNFTPKHNFVNNPKPTLWNKFKYSFIPYEEAYTFRLGLDDTQDTIFMNITVHVKNVNRAPTITHYIPVTKAKVGEIVKFGVIVEDPDNDKLTYDWNFGFLDSKQGNNVIYRKYTKPGTKTIKVKVSDGFKTTIKTWKIKVTE